MRRFFLGGGLTLVTLLDARASTAGFISPSFRGTAGSEFALWDNPNNFTVAYSTSLAAAGNTVNGDGPADPLGNGSSDAVLRQLDPGAFLTGGGGAGNIYSFGTALQFNLADANTAPVETVVFQTRTTGTELDYATVALSYDLGGGPQALTATRVETDRTNTGSFGVAVSSLWTFNLSGRGVTDYALTFSAAGSSTSFDSAALDVHFAAVPEPAGYAALGGAALVVFAAFRRTRRGHLR